MSDGATIKKESAVVNEHPGGEAKRHKNTHSRTPRTNWGTFLNQPNILQTVPDNQLTVPNEKVQMLKNVDQDKQQSNVQERRVLKIRNPIVTQTIEVMNQTDMIQTLIDTYANKMDYGYVVNPCQMMPMIDFPPENVMNLVTDSPFSKPLWFIPPIDSSFTLGHPKTNIQLAKATVNAAIRKSLCGLLKIGGFNEITDDALLMFTDGIDEFLKTFMEYLNDVIIQEARELDKTIDIMILEKAYYSITNQSFTTLHNYFKNEILQTNTNEVKEFKDLFHEYDKLMQESQRMQRDTLIKEEKYLNFLDLSNPTFSSEGSVNVNIMNFFESDNGGFKDIFEGDTTEENINMTVVTPGSTES